MNYSQEIHIQRLRLSELDDSLSCFEDILADKISKKYQSARDYPNILIHLAGKTLWTFREIICLCSFGFPEGALSLARNIYEQSITLAFLNELIAQYKSYRFLDRLSPKLRLDFSLPLSKH